MPSDLDALLSTGGKPLLDLLRYCVLSMRLEPLFVLLVREYASAPTAAKAVTLFDVFCAVGAEGRLSCRPALPPLAPHLSQAIEPLRVALERKRTTPVDPDNAVFVPLPPKFLFDELVRAIRDDSSGVFQLVASEYDPARTPYENLPGGKLNDGQRFFVERVWQPRLRPRLVSAGFWRVATLGA